MLLTQIYIQQKAKNIFFHTYNMYYSKIIIKKTQNDYKCVLNEFSLEGPSSI